VGIYKDSHSHCNHSSYLIHIHSYISYVVFIYNVPNTQIKYFMTNTINMTKHWKFLSIFFYFWHTNLLHLRMIRLITSPKFNRYRISSLKLKLRAIILDHIDPTNTWIIVLCKIAFDQDASLLLCRLITQLNQPILE